MDIVGRDQPDQELTIEFDRERCVWKFKKAETELWKQPPNPLLEAINNFLTEDKPEWEGTATELVSQLPDMQIQANVLSRKLNVVNSQLLNDYGIFYDNKRGHERKIILKRLEPIVYQRRYASVATVFFTAGWYRKYRRYRRKPTQKGLSDEKRANFL